MKKTIKSISILFTVLCLIVLSLSIYAERNLPDIINCADYSVSFGKIYTAKFTSNTMPVSADPNGSEKKYYESEIKLLNTVPVKTVKMAFSDRRYVLPGGELVGIRLNTDGVIVTGTEEFFSDGKKNDPAGKAGIVAGDVIISANGQKITDNDTFSDVIEKSEGKTVDIVLQRSGRLITVRLKPEISDMTNRYKCGIWIRDCTSGIGTLTYRDPSNSVIATLGHAIYEHKTKEIVPAIGGILKNADITGIKKGKDGEAGELRGSIGNSKLGSLKVNCEMGVYGHAEVFSTTEPLMPVAFIQEVSPGKASIISSVIDGKKNYYDIEIEKIDYSDMETNKNMVIKITDKKLIEQTGGIIQGMSGSPVIQNGMLVGAVTHVFLNDPEKGYAVFAENMMKISDAVAKADAA